MFPFAILLTIFFCFVVKADKLIWALLIGVPVFAFLLALLVYVICIPIAFIVASRITSKVGAHDRHLKTVIREVS
jgi:hypothetical protein